MNLDDIAASANVLDRRNEEKTFHLFNEVRPSRREQDLGNYSHVTPPSELLPDKDTIVQSIQATRQDPYEDNSIPSPSFINAITDAISRTPASIARAWRSQWY